MTTIADDHGLVLRVLMGVVAADLLDADEGRASLQACYTRLTGRPLDAAAVGTGRAHAVDHPGAWLDAARQLARALEPEARDRVLASAFEIACADGFVLEEEDRVLATLAAALGMSDAEYRHSIERLLAAAQA
ncbi:MAG: TerB family tellurite resistance protein [Deltaproteobacteria bacterium]|jgi:uncharacterized tellurite resistance protein B-like protein|nr:TerB family tellurite resistance protein [Deltaproteobacteria bacterium]MBK8238001.1 TerB family tellurite resistance protein [Deltaproteobacteria bacterium]MBK8718659.1 TerB family tellurite resistance protein [Deltaproteobacteria bacterium]MBP7290138.1 TerB family tellurite resistance protein [Nannocystaceae bacterium]